jgi:hypothetical protein
MYVQATLGGNYVWVRGKRYSKSIIIAITIFLLNMSLGREIRSGGILRVIAGNGISSELPLALLDTQCIHHPGLYLNW